MSWSVNFVTSFYNYVGYGHYRVLVDSKIEELSGGRRRVEEEIVNMVMPGVHIWTNVLYFQSRHYYALLINVLLTIRLL